LAAFSARYLAHCSGAPWVIRNHLARSLFACDILRKLLRRASREKSASAGLITNRGEICWARAAFLGKRGELRRRYHQEPRISARRYWDQGRARSTRSIWTQPLTTRAIKAPNYWGKDVARLSPRPRTYQYALAVMLARPRCPLVNCVFRVV
jgi:hypothetical protein